MNTQKPKVILADSNELFREALSAFLKTKTEIEFVSDASTGKAVIDILKQKHADIVILDIEINQMDVNSTFDILKKRFPDTRIIIFSSQNHLSRMPEYMAKGANCFLVKSCSVETLLKAIKIVKSEGFFFDNATSKVMIDTLIQVKNGSSPFVNSDFTDRETEILRKICDGQTNKEIANSMHLSTSTIDFHKSKIYSKAQCNNSTQLLRYALKAGIVAIS